MSLKLTKKPRHSPAQQHRIIREEVKKALEPVGKQHVSQRDAFTSGWKPAHRPKFKAVIGVGPKQIFIRVIIENAKQRLSKYGGTIRDLWGWINEGTPAHLIRARFAKALRFVVGGATRFAPFVRHPGTQAQRPNERINQRLRRFEQRQIRLGFKKGFERVGRDR